MLMTSWAVSSVPGGGMTRFAAAWASRVRRSTGWLFPFCQVDYVGHDRSALFRCGFTKGSALRRGRGLSMQLVFRYADSRGDHSSQLFFVPAKNKRTPS
jgi:hypothetical protein